MSLLVIAALVWLGIHTGLAGTPLREWLVGRIGELPFRGLFSLLSLGALVFLVHAWSATPIILLWYAPGWLQWVLVAVMLAAFVLFVASLSRRNPTMVPMGVPTGVPARVVTTAAVRDATAQPPRGIQRVTRHPMLWSSALWAGVHIVANGDITAIVFFGTFLVTALAGMPSIDAKLARRDPALWQALSATTSIVPFVAIMQGRNRFVPREIGWWVLLIAVVAWAAVLFLHPWLFGVAPVVM
jgi:uncharacterized membrane protein